MGFLDTLIFGYKQIVDSANTALIQRGRVKFIGATIADDTANAQTVITVTGGGGSTPTGTGLPHVVGGVQQAAASLLVNADVDPAAAIAVSKLAGTLPVANGGTGLAAVPGSTTQALYNNAGALGATANVLSDGTISNGGYPLINGNSSAAYVGTTSAFGGGNQVGSLNLAASNAVALTIGGTTYVYLNASSTAMPQFWKPIMGGYDSGAQSPLRFAALSIAQASTATTTLSTTQSCYPTLSFTGTPGGAFAVVAPLLSGSAFDVYNGTPSTMTFGGASGATVSIPTLTKARCVCFDGANYR